MIGRVRPTIIPTEPTCRSVPAAMSLFHVMKSISRERFGQPWGPHLDRVLWKEAANPRNLDAACLQYLAKHSGGWWSWRNEENPGPTFVRLESWVTYFETINDA